MNRQLQVVTVDAHEVEQGDVLVGNAGGYTTFAECAEAKAVDQ